MIADTCRCGAAVTIKYNHASCERIAYTEWLLAHSSCRHADSSTSNDIAELKDCILQSRKLEYYKKRLRRR